MLATCFIFWEFWCWSFYVSMCCFGFLCFSFQQSLLASQIFVPNLLFLLWRESFHASLFCVSLESILDTASEISFWWVFDLFVSWVKLPSSIVYCGFWTRMWCLLEACSVLDSLATVQYFLLQMRTLRDGESTPWRHCVFPSS